jgi:hypothetical protein
MFSSENGPDIETVHNASEFLGDTLNIRDDDSALVYCVFRRTISCLWLHCGVIELLWVVTSHQIMSWFLNFVVEIFLVPTYDLGSVGQTMNDSTFYMM